MDMATKSLDSIFTEIDSYIEPIRYLIVDRSADKTRKKPPHRLPETMPKGYDSSIDYWIFLEKAMDKIEEAFKELKNRLGTPAP